MVFDLLNFGIDDLKKLNNDELASLSDQIRGFLIKSLEKTGGHLSSNLGVVELTLAIHRVFDSPKDKIIWDVGHQCYTHKIITNRGNAFSTLRQYDGISGFPKRTESPHDAFDAGHSSTSISAGLGMAIASKLKGEDRSVISVIGDGAMTGGMVFEALNQMGGSDTPMIVVLNDNGMSISNNVGGFKNHLTQIRSSKGYIGTKRKIKKGIPGIARILEKVKNSIKSFFIEPNLFEEIGIKYLGPIDGHNIKVMEKVFINAKNMKSPVLVHVITKKGKGYKPAEDNPTKYHGISAVKFDDEKELTSIGNSEVFAREICEIAKENADVVAISAAMSDGTKLCLFAKEFPDRCFDVGIAEQHAVTFAAGLAAAGMRPVFAVYSTFLQRGYDQVLHDVCLQNLPVILAVDRAGMVGEDGETHHGIYDISFLSSMPNMTILSPTNQDEIAQALRAAIDFNGPIAIRYPRKNLPDINTDERFRIGKWTGDISKKVIIAGGSMYDLSQKAILLLQRDGHEYSLIKAVTTHPIDFQTLDRISNIAETVICVEDGIVQGGFCSAVSAYLHEKSNFKGKFVSFAIPSDKLQFQGAMPMLYRNIGLDVEGIHKRILLIEEEI